MNNYDWSSSYNINEQSSALIEEFDLIEIARGMTDFISSKLSISTDGICRENKDVGEIGYTVLRGFERGEWVAD